MVLGTPSMILGTPSMVLGGERLLGTAPMGPTIVKAGFKATRWLKDLILYKPAEVIRRSRVLVLSVQSTARKQEL